MLKCLLILTALITALPASAIFYDDDDYVEIDRIKTTDAPVNWRIVARSVAIMINTPAQGPLDLSKRPAMSDRYNKLEPDYSYAAQPRVANQTAFLVARDKVMTAGHAGIQSLQNAAFVFDYTWDSSKKQLRKPTYKPSEIYRCKEILLHRNDKNGDYALIQLNKPVMGRRPLTLAAISDAAQLNM